jgi:hypothetical protein
VGLPGFTEDTGEWTEAPGLASMVVESLMVVLACAVLVPRRRAERSTEPATTTASPGLRPGPAVG